MNLFNLFGIQGQTRRPQYRKPLACEALESRELLSGNPVSITNIGSGHYINVSFNLIKIEYVLRDTETGSNLDSKSWYFNEVSEIDILTNSGADTVVIDLMGFRAAPPRPVRVHAGGDRDVLELRNAVVPQSDWIITGRESGGYPNLTFDGINVLKMNYKTNVFGANFVFQPGASLEEIVVKPDRNDNTVDLSQFTTGMTVNLKDRTLGGDLVVEGIHTVFGSSGNDRLIGSDIDDRLFGNGGADTLLGHGGNDILVGDAGDDRLYGDAGKDSLIGGTGADWLEGGAGADTVINGWTKYDRAFEYLTDLPSFLVDAANATASNPQNVFDDGATDFFASRKNSTDTTGDFNYLEPARAVLGRDAFGRLTLSSTPGDRIMTYSALFQ